MTPQERRVLAAQLWATRASIDAALVALGELVDELDPADDLGETMCTHPPELRDDLTTMGGPDGWRCRGCGFTTLPDTTTET